ncbi:MAG: hypothetical protein AAFZ65_20460, partial [Planctomycetota bacterium]
MKRLVKLLAVLAVLAIAVVAGLFLLRDKAFAALIETAGTEATGQETTVEAVSTGLLSGEVGIAGLAVDNPAGFGPEPFLRLGGLDLAVPYSALAEDPIHVGLVSVEGLELRLTRQGTELNYQAILDHLESLGAGGESEAPAEEPPSGDPTGPGGAPAKTVVVDRVRIADWTLHLDVGQPVVGPQEVSMGELVIENLQVTGDQALNLAVGRVLDRLIEAALEQAPGLPAELAPFVDSLRGALADGAQVEDLDALVDEARAQAEQLVADQQAELTGAAEATLNAELDKQLDSLSEKLGEDAAPKVDEAVKALGGLLGGGQDGR